GNGLPAWRAIQSRPRLCVLQPLNRFPVTFIGFVKSIIPTIPALRSSLGWGYPRPRHARVAHFVCGVVFRARVEVFGLVLVVLERRNRPDAVLARREEIDHRLRHLDDSARLIAHRVNAYQPFAQHVPAAHRAVLADALVVSRLEDQRPHTLRNRRPAVLNKYRRISDAKKLGIAYARPDAF